MRQAHNMACLFLFSSIVFMIYCNEILNELRGGERDGEHYDGGYNSNPDCPYFCHYDCCFKNQEEKIAGVRGIRYVPGECNEN